MGVELLHEFGFGGMLQKIGESNVPLYIVQPRDSMAVEAIESVYSEPGAMKDMDRAIRILDTNFRYLKNTFRAHYQGIELQQTDMLELKKLDSSPLPLPVLASDNASYIFPQMGGKDVIYSGINDTDTQVATSFVKDLWTDASEYQLDGPPWTEVIQSLAEKTTTETKDVLLELLEARENSNQENDVHFIYLMLLAAARTQVTQKAISSWATEYGVVSEANISRYKQWLAGEGIIDEEMITKHHPGRPTSELYIKGEYLRESSNEDVYEIVARMNRMAESD